MKKGKIVIVDDELSMVEFLSNMLIQDGYQVESTTDGKQAIDLVRANSPDIVISDIKMSPLNGLQILKQVKQINPEINVIMITAFGSIEGAVGAVKDGAYDYITKPFKIENIRSVIKRALSTRRLITRDESIQAELKEKYGFSNIIGRSEKMREIYGVIKKLSKSSSTVLIYGESGTGKELVARAIHFNSIRSNKPFVSVNCGALPESLLESELFGHEKGSFTGAISTKEGLFETANHGSFFLDEIGETTTPIQVKLLRVLQEREIKRVGGIKNISVDVRVIAATSKDLKEEIKQKNFREDLYYRLNVIPLYLPPLRERREDIPLLANHFLSKYVKNQNSSVREISPEAMDLLSDYDWPGNVRELENIIENIVTLTENKVILKQDLSGKLGPKTGLAADKEEKRDQTQTQVLPEDEKPFKEKTAEFEKELINQALESAQGNISRAARELKITRQDLQYKIKKYKLI